MLILQDGYLVAVPDTGTSTISMIGGVLPAVHPTMVIRVDATVETANETTRLIDGSDAVRIVGDPNLATGTLTLLFSDDASVIAARQLLAAPGVFTLDVPERPAVNMTFVRDGSLRPGMHDEIRDVWEMEVGFREVSS